MKLINRLAIICSIAFLLPFTVQCQHEWWITGGFSVNRLVVKDYFRSYEDIYSNKGGFQLGVSTRFLFNPTVQLETGAQLALRGSFLEWEDNILGYRIDVSGPAHVVYLEVPILARLALTSAYQGVYLCGGVYAGLALFGVAKGSYFSRGEYETYSETLYFGNDENVDDLRSLDAGFITGLGMNWPEVDMRFTYNHGVTNVSVARENGLRASTRSLNFTVAFNFDVFKKKKEDKIRIL